MSENKRHVYDREPIVKWVTEFVKKKVVVKHLDFITAFDKQWGFAGVTGSENNFSIGLQAKEIAKLLAYHDDVVKKEINRTSYLIYRKEEYSVRDIWQIIEKVSSKSS